MENTQGLITYTKAGVPTTVPASAASANATGAPSMIAESHASHESRGPKSRIKIKTALAVIGILLFLAVASVGVFIAQRQQQISGPVAPNAPSSTPSAAGTESACFVEFSVPAPDGIANCISKKAFTEAPGAASSQPIAENKLLPRGTEFFYQVTISANKLTSGNVSFSDQLPPVLTYIEDAANTPGLIYDATTKTLAKSLGQMQPDQIIKINFKVKLAADAALGKFTNNASIATEGGSQIEPIKCASSLAVLPEGKAICEAKTAYTMTDDGNTGELLAAGSEVNPGDKFIYRITASADEPTLSGAVIVDTLPSKVKFAKAISGGLVHQDGVVRAEIDSFTYSNSTPSPTKNVAYDFIVQVDASASPGVFTNHVSILNGENANDTSVCSLDLVIPENKCDSACVVNAQCPTGLSCINAVCRLAENPTDTQCKPKIVASPSPTPTPTPTPSPAPTPTPAIGCNDSCTTNADCTNPNHICYSTDTGNKCRLASNVDNLSCVNPVVSTPTPQPELPQELPETGWSELSNWLKAGLVTIGIGAALLLLL